MLSPPADQLMHPMFHAMSPPDVTNEASPCCSGVLCLNQPSDRDLQRADGCGRLVLSGSENGTRIEDVFERSPTRIMFPRTGSRPVEEAVIINTGGGVAGGDRLECSVNALPGASIAVTSQAAEKVYRALHDPARVATRLKACESARLAWLPQGTIVFNGARIHRTTEIELFSGAELLALEWLVLGRAAHGEIMAGGSITDSWRVKKEGRLIWADSFRISDEIFVYLNRKALLSTFNSIATLVYFGPDLDRKLELLRQILSSLECDCAVTLVSGLIVARFATKPSSDLNLPCAAFFSNSGQSSAPDPFKYRKCGHAKDCRRKEKFMNLTPREKDKLMISLAAIVARERLKRGVKLNYPETVALITDFILEAARDGKSVAQLMSESRKVLSRDQVMEGIAEMIPEMQLEATFLDGTKLVSIHNPIR